MNAKNATKERNDFMALTKAKVREILSNAGVDTENISEAVDKIMNGHIASIDALREERDGFKETAEKLPDIQKELDDMKKASEKNDGWKTKYDDLKKEYDGYKEEQTAKAEKSKKDKAYRDLLKEIGISEKRLDAILKVTNLDDVKLNDEGGIDGKDDLVTALKDEWSDFITTEGNYGADVNNPPNPKNEPPKGKSRAAEIEARYHSDLYGGKVGSNDKND